MFRAKLVDGKLRLPKRNKVQPKKQTNRGEFFSSFFLKRALHSKHPLITHITPPPHHTYPLIESLPLCHIRHQLRGLFPSEELKEENAKSVHIALGRSRSGCDKLYTKKKSILKKRLKLKLINYWLLPLSKRKTG